MITLYANVQRPLSVAEADGNIQDLDTRLQAIEQQGVAATTLTAIAVDDAAGTITYTYSDGSVWGPYRLPASLFTPRGAWLTGTAYLVRDYVTNAGSSYIAAAAHTAGASFADDLAAGKWQLNSAKGVDGAAGAPYMNFVGFYDNTRAYNAADGVLYLSNGTYNIFRAVVAVPAGNPPGTFQPGGVQMPYWTAQSSNATAEHGTFVSGKPAAGATIYWRRFARSQSFFAALAGAVAGLRTPPAAAFKLSVRRNGTEFGTISWAANGTVPTLAGSAVTFAIGDVLTIVAPSTQDAAAADLDVTLLTYPV